MSENETRYEMLRDPFRMLTYLVDLVCQELGVEFDFEKIPAYENETFLLRPHNDEGLPNFVYKKDLTDIQWYKTFGRDISCSKQLTRTQYNAIFVDCMASLYKL